MSEALTPDMLAWGYTITHPGTYTLVGRTWLLGTEGIRIEASGVTLDLQGFTIMGNPETKACISLKRGATRVRVQDGSVQGGERAVFSRGGGSSLRFQNLHIFGFTFAAFLLLPSRGVHLTNCSVGRASAAPYGSLFGVVALPAGVFRAAERLLQNASLESSDVAGGVGLTFERVTISDITPLFTERAPEPRDERPPDSCFSRRYPSRRQRTRDEACITDTGFRVNMSGCEAPTDGAFPTSNLQRRQQVLGDLLRELPDGSSSQLDWSQIEGAGCHAVAIFNWKDVVGLHSDTDVATPSDLPKSRQSARFQSAWGGDSATLVRNITDGTEYVEPDELADYPLNSEATQVLQNSRPIGAYVLGALGSYIVC